MASPISTVVRIVVEYSPALVNGVLTTNTCKQEKHNSAYTDTTLHSTVNTCSYFPVVSCVYSKLQNVLMCVCVLQ